MRITESCRDCLYSRQKNLTDNEDYLAEIGRLLDNRGENDTSPYMVYLFHKVYVKYFGETKPYQKIKKKYNDMMLEIEESVRQKIETSENPIATALMYARIGNYIDYGAMSDVDENVLLALFDDAKLSDRDQNVIASFMTQCERADNFLLIADNCGEIVLDKLFLEQMHQKFPRLAISVMVRGGEVLNDVTREDAAYVGIDAFARVVSNGLPIAGTVYEMLSDEGKEAIDQADVILAKGQGNYESLSQTGRHIFYSFLCKCELFTNKFDVPKFTGMFLEE